MITTQQVIDIVNEHLAGSDKFIVDIQVKSGNVIHVFIDGDTGVNVDDCITLSRFLEKSLDREKEDFELNVSSPGAENPVKQLRQIKKAIGKEFKAIFNDGKEIKGVLTNVTDEDFILETSEKVKLEGKKSKQLVVSQHQLKLSEIKQLKRIISFK